MSKHVPGKKLKPEVRYIRLSDGLMRELRMDFSAKAEIEAMLSPGIQRLAQKLGRPPRKEEVQAYDFGMGSLKQTAMMAYCLCASWREDNDLADESFAQFKRLMPDEDEALQAIATAVNACTAHLQDHPEDEVPGQGNVDEVEPQSEATGPA